MQAAPKDKSFANTISSHRTSGEIWTIIELFQYLFTGGLVSNFTLPSLGLAVIDKFGKNYKPKSWIDFENNLFGEMKEQLYDLLNDEEAILICPTLPVVAPKHGPFPLVLYSADVAPVCMFNVLELPATQVPTSIGTKGLPLGTQMYEIFHPSM